MRLVSGQLGPGVSSQAAALSDSESLFSGRSGTALGIAALLHLAFGFYAYLRPPPPPSKKSRPIVVEVVKPKPAPRLPEPEPEPQPPEAPKPATPPKAPPPPVRAQPKIIQPATPKPAQPDDEKSSAAVLPPQPETKGPEGPGPIGPGPGTGKGPVNLFPGSLAGVVGAPGYDGKAIPRRADILFGDDRLKPKVEPEFTLVAEKGGGYKCSARNFTAHIKADGRVEFEKRFPIGFNKGGTFSIDPDNWFSKKSDPYYADKRRFLEFSDKIRSELRAAAAKEYQERSMATLKDQLHAIWRSELPGPARRRDIFEKWEDCADDKDDLLSRKGRHIIEDFVKTYLPSGSTEGFTDAELAKINSGRKDLPPFDPYKSLR